MQIDEKSHPQSKIELVQFNHVIGILSDSVIVVDNDLLIVSFNQASTLLFGYERDAVVGCSINTLVPVAERSRHTALAQSFAKEALTTEILQGDRRPMFGRRQSGREFPIEVSLTHVILDGDPYTVAISRDASKQVAREQHLEQQLNVDPLTGLYNRIYLDKFGDDFISNPSSLSAVLFIDLDFFKQVNDDLGHECGDCLLKAVADRIKSQVKETDSIIRFGGDEFVVLLGDVQDRSIVKRIVNSISKALARPFKIKSHSVSISASIGIAIYPNDGDRIVELMRMADIAMYHAKKFHNTYRFFTQDYL